jgi:hypothetical protein
MNPPKTITTLEALVTTVRLLRAVNSLRKVATIVVESRESEKRIAAMTAIVFLDDAEELLKRVFESLNVLPKMEFGTLHTQQDSEIAAAHTDISFALAVKMREELGGTVASDEAKDSLRGALGVRIALIETLLNNATQVFRE